MSPRRVYLDYNATAPLRPEIEALVAPLLFGGGAVYGNASSVHWAGRAAKEILERARSQVALHFGRKPSEVVFTSGGSEANNLALRGVLAREPSRALVVSSVEHPSVSAVAKAESAQRRVEIVPVDRDGRLDLTKLEAALARGPALASIMAVNNETGIVSPVEEVATLAERHGAILHLDAVQAVARVPTPDAPLVTLSGHKLGGLKGAGALVFREATTPMAQIVGGAQERGHRAGTEPIAAIASLGAALELATATREAEMARLSVLRDRLEAAVAALGGTPIAGAPRVAQTSCVLFRGVERETLLIALDLAGFAASSGSACSSGSLEPSPVLRAMGLSADEALSAIRFSLGFATTDDDVDALIAALPEILRRVRA